MAEQTTAQEQTPQQRSVIKLEDLPDFKLPIVEVDGRRELVIGIEYNADNTECTRYRTIQQEGDKIISRIYLKNTFADIKKDPYATAVLDAKSFRFGLCRTRLREAGLWQ